MYAFLCVLRACLCLHCLVSGVWFGQPRDKEARGMRPCGCWLFVSCVCRAVRQLRASVYCFVWGLVWWWAGVRGDGAGCGSGRRGSRGGAQCGAAGRGRGGGAGGPVGARGGGTGRDRHGRYDRMTAPHSAQFSKTSRSMTTQLNREQPAAVEQPRGAHGAAQPPPSPVHTAGADT